MPTNKKAANPVGKTGTPKKKSAPRPRVAVSVVIPHRESESIEAAMKALADAAAFAGICQDTPRLCEEGHVTYEVLAVSGNQPSAQRNRAVREARGEYIYFLDNDSIPAPDCFARLSRFFAEHPAAAILGGPSLTPKSDGARQQAFGAVLGSFLGTAFMRARYRAFGVLRATSDRELILCNLAMRRSVFLELGGFDERLYPNEENALMDAARERGFELWHDPAFTVTRSQRPGFAAFVRQLFGYGRGRGEQMRLAPRLGNIVPFVFMLFPAGILCLPFIFLFIPPLAWIAARVVPLYPVLTLLAALASSRRHGPLVVLYTWISFFLCHFCYGCGLWVGLFAPLRSRKVQARVFLKRHECGTR